MFATLVGVATILGALAEMAVLALIVCDRNKKTKASGEADENGAR